MADGKKGSGSKTAKSNQKGKRKLTPRENKLVELVAEGVPKGQAYVQAGFKNTPTRYQNAYQKLRKPYMQEAVAERHRRYEEMAGISKEVAIGRLVEIALGSPADLTDEAGYFNFEKAKERGSDALVKKHGYTMTGPTYEMHDPIAAIRTLGQFCGWLKQPEANEASTDAVARKLFERLTEDLRWAPEQAAAYVINKYPEAQRLLTDGGER